MNAWLEFEPFEAVILTEIETVSFEPVRQRPWLSQIPR